MRWLLLLVLGTAAFLCYRHIRLAGGAISIQGSAYLWPGIGVAAAAALGSLLVLSSEGRPTPGSRRHWSQKQWIEVALIVGFGMAFRSVFLFVPPTISHDAYRYVWDAHLVAHGISPYLYPASDPALAFLRDHAIWPELNWPNAPTVYPPGAELLFLLVNAIAPLNITAMQLTMAAFDAGAGVLTLLLLRHYQLDPRRVIVYWWNPIPVLEFVYSAHVDAAAAFLVALAVLLALQHWRGARLLAGIALGMAALIKLYPLLFAVALLRRRDWLLLLGLAATVALVSLPFIRLGLGSGGFLVTYFSQRFVDQGIVFRLITQVFVDRRWQYALQALALALFTAAVWRLRQERRIGPAGAIAALYAAWIVVSPHLFPWYVGGVLPFLALCLRLSGSAPSSKASSPVRDPDPQSTLPALALWLFTLEMPFAYVIFAPGYNANLFLLFFLAPLALSAFALARRRYFSASFSACAEAPTSADSPAPRAGAIVSEE